MRIFNIELPEWVENLIYALIQVLFVIALILGFHVLGNDNPTGEIRRRKARCESLQGGYGAGVCYRNGKEV